MLDNLNNRNMQTPAAILEQQAHLVNFKKQRISHMVGLREIILMRNRLGDRFARSLQNALSYDKYLKVINLAGNDITQAGLKVLIKQALIDNTSIVAFDARLNPGCTDKISRQLSLCMLKNIEKMQNKGLAIKPEWIKYDLVSHGIPDEILRQLHIRNPKENSKRKGSVSSGRRGSVASSINSNSNQKANIKIETSGKQIGQVKVDSEATNKKAEPVIISQGFSLEKGIQKQENPVSKQPAKEH